MNELPIDHREELLQSPEAVLLQALERIAVERRDEEGIMPECDVLSSVGVKVVFTEGRSALQKFKISISRRPGRDGGMNPAALGLVDTKKGEPVHKTIDEIHFGVGPKKVFCWGRFMKRKQGAEGDLDHEFGHFAADLQKLVELANATTAPVPQTIIRGRRLADILHNI